MQSFFNYEIRFIRFAFRTRYLRPVEYLVKSLLTVSLYIKEKPDTVWLQLPPSFLLHITFLYRYLFNRSLVVVADCHNASFRAPWIRVPGTLALLNRCNLVLVHNSLVLQHSSNPKIKANRIHVLEDPPATINASKHAAKGTTGNIAPQIVFPCSFNHDEPIAELLNAARLMPEVNIIITGNTDRAAGIHDLNNLPDNVELTGFIPSAEFDQLISRADVVLGLTRLEGIQLSVASEALGAGKPMVLSNTQALTRLFYQGVVYVDSLSAESIAHGCRNAIAGKERLQREVRQLRNLRYSLWFEQAEAVSGKLHDQQHKTVCACT